ncbi:F-box/FBD/LRR-repeat protein At1g13570 [Linum perenne]
MARRSTDRFSSLPDEVRERILMFLPLREAAKASILSSKWRNLWTNLPTLVIDESFGDEIAARRSNANEEEVVGKLIMLEVCRVLMLHRGPLMNLSLSLPKWGNQFDQILRFLPYSTLESLTILNGGFCHLSKPLFSSFLQLKTLRLSNCDFTFSSVSFEGFDRLTVLELRNVLFGRRIQPRLSFKCPLLTTLVLDNCFPNPRIVIEEAPILECLYLDGETLRQFEYSHCSEFLRNVVICESLATFLHLAESFRSIESLSVRKISKLMTPMKQWVKLRQLSLDGLWINTQSGVLFVVRWIMKSPNLQRLVIRMAERRDPTHVIENYDDGAELGDDAYKYEGSRLLRKVQVKKIRGTENEMTLISWLLNYSPALDRMEIQLSTALSDAEKMSFLIELHGLQRASSKARIIIIA